MVNENSNARETGKAFYEKWSYPTYEQYFDAVHAAVINPDFDASADTSYFVNSRGELTEETSNTLPRIGSFTIQMLKEQWRPANGAFDSEILHKTNYSYTDDLRRKTSLVHAQSTTGAKIKQMEELLKDFDKYGGIIREEAEAQYWAVSERVRQESGRISSLMSTKIFAPPLQMVNPEKGSARHILEISTPQEMVVYSNHLRVARKAEYNNESEQSYADYSKQIERDHARFVYQLSLNPADIAQVEAFVNYTQASMYMVLDQNGRGKALTLSEIQAVHQDTVSPERATTFDRSFYEKWNYPDFPTFYRAFEKSIADPNFHLTPQEGGYHVNGNGDVSEMGAILYPTFNYNDLHRLKQSAEDVTDNVEQKTLDAAFYSYNESLNTKAEMIEKALQEIARNPVDEDQTTWATDIQNLRDRKKDIQLQQLHILEDAKLGYTSIQEAVQIARAEIEQQLDRPLLTEPLWSYHPKIDESRLQINTLRDLISIAQYEREMREDVAYLHYSGDLRMHRMANGNREEEQVYNDRYIKQLDAIAKNYETFNQKLIAGPAGIEQIQAFFDFTKTGIYADSPQTDGGEPKKLSLQDIERHYLVDTTRDFQDALGQKQAQDTRNRFDEADILEKQVSDEKVQQEQDRERREESQRQIATEEYAMFIQDTMAHGQVTSDRHLLLNKNLTTVEALDMRQEAIAAEKLFGNHTGLEKAFLEQWSDKIASVERHSTPMQQKAFLNKEALALKDILAPIYHDMQAEKYGIQNDKAFSEKDIAKIFSNGEKTAKAIYASIQAHRNETVLDWGYKESKSQVEIKEYVEGTNDMLVDQLYKQESYFLDTTGKEVIAKQRENGEYEVSTVHATALSVEIMSEKEAGAYLVRENMIAVDKDALEYAKKTLTPAQNNGVQALTRQQERSVSRSL
ncbi:hypothetical protein HCJ39_07065 [Listeria rocourtiae]|uniref:hypothetical protein n=1 Tax=Listeria rocourtiae TaxID=647910 RepID=UPI0016273824|nr:hypothetical protein [Listeria rocourtiae]MBC1604470.1 hypothetical protein [Listeria rocourtiae]